MGHGIIHLELRKVITVERDMILRICTKCNLIKSLKLNNIAIKKKTLKTLSHKNRLIKYLTELLMCSSTSKMTSFILFMSVCFQIFFFFYKFPYSCLYF